MTNHSRLYKNLDQIYKNNHHNHHHHHNDDDDDHSNNQSPIPHESQLAQYDIVKPNDKSIPWIGK